MKTNKIIYWVFTGLICLWMLFQGFMFTFNSSTMEELFTGLGMPVALIMPLGIAKILAVVAILWKKSQLLKQLAYVGLSIDFIVAIFSHISASDGHWPGAAVALVLLIVSFIYDRKVF